MKEFELEFRVRNNLLKQRRIELGMNQGQFAEAVGITASSYSALETMRESPLHAKGGWRMTAQKIADYHGVGPDELWPGTVLAVEVSKGTRLLDAEEIGGLLLGEHHMRLLASRPHEELMEKEDAEAVDEALGRLRPSERHMIEGAYGIGGGEEKPLNQLAEELGVSSSRAAQIRERGLAKMQYRIGWKRRPRKP